MAKRLNLNQKEFCKLYSSDREFFGNGVLAYAEAYHIDLSTKRGYQTAASSAFNLLKNTDILAYINKLLDATINEQFVDKQLAFLIIQSADFHVKLGAIKEYNVLKQRVKKKLDINLGLSKETATLLGLIDGGTKGKLPTRKEIKEAKK